MSEPTTNAQLIVLRVSLAGIAMVFQTGGGCGSMGYPCDEQIWNGEVQSFELAIDGDTVSGTAQPCGYFVQPRNVDPEDEILGFGLDARCGDVGVSVDLFVGDLRTEDWDPESAVATIEYGLSADDPQGGCRLQSPVVVLAWSRGGGAAPYPQLVTEDFVAEVSVELDLSGATGVLRTDPERPCGVPLSLRIEATLAYDAAQIERRDGTCY